MKNSDQRVAFSFRKQGVFWCAAFLLSPPAPAAAQTAVPKAQLPNLILCEKNKDVIAHVAHGKIDWDYTLDGPLKDIQSQPLTGRYLVTGGTRQVFLIRKVWKGCRVLWDWVKLKDVSVQSAVAADWDLQGNPSLILAADTQNQRLFLAEAKSNGIKIRWEYPLPAAPRRVHLCTDSGNFLVTLKDSTVEEIYFQEDKVAWRVGREDGLKDAVDAVRDPWANTYVADAAGGDVLCFTPSKQAAWKTHLPFASGVLQDMALSLFRKNGKRLLLVSVHFSGKGEVAQDVLYVLNPETGKVLAWSDRLEKGGYPAFFKVVPDKAEYYKKQ